MMRQEHEEERQYPASAHSPLLNRDARDAASRWLARFAPLLGGLDELGAEECRHRLAGLPELRAEGEQALSLLEQHATTADVSLLTTLRDAVREVAGHETDVRRRLARLAPGDPAGEVDLAAIQERLAEVAARREVGTWAGSSVEGARLELKTSPANWGAAGMLGIFSLGWNAFTTVHAVLFIGGFMQAIGLFALAFLLFYAMFWAVGFGMAWAAFRAACKEQIVLQGTELTMNRRLFGLSWDRKYAVNRASRALLVEATVRQQGSTARDVAVYDAEGREVRVASGRPLHEQDRLVARLNEYFAALPA